MHILMHIPDILLKEKGIKLSVQGELHIYATNLIV